MPGPSASEPPGVAPEPAPTAPLLHQLRRAVKVREEGSHVLHRSTELVRVNLLKL